jgi:hypothetical protein
MARRSHNPLHKKQLEEMVEAWTTLAAEREKRLLRNLMRTDRRLQRRLIPGLSPPAPTPKARDDPRTRPAQLKDLAAMIQ